MKAKPDRRRMLISSTATLAGACLGYPRMSRGIEPFNRAGFKLKSSLAAYSYRSLLSGDKPELSLFDFVDDCALFGLDGTELTSYYFPEEVTQDYLVKLRRHCFLRGLDVSGTAIRNDFGFAPGKKRDAEIAHVKKWIEYSAKLGAPVIRIFAGHQKPDVTTERTHELIVSGIEECCSYARKYGVHLALENHGGPTSTAEGLLRIVRDVDSPWFGINLDTGNFETDDVYGAIESTAPFALNVQVKVVTKKLSGEKQPMDFERLVNILKAANYRGYVVLEYEEDGNPRKQSREYLKQMTMAFG